jgi:hypothetical protein
MSDEFMIGVYAISVCIVMVSFIVSLSRQFQVSLEDLIVAIICSFFPIINTIAAFLVVCIWFAKSESIIIYRKKL